MTWLPVGLAAGVLALALSRGSLFGPLRARLTGWPEKLATCPLCLGAWLCAAGTGIQGAPPGLAWPIALGAAWAVSTAFAVAVDRLAGE